MSWLDDEDFGKVLIGVVSLIVVVIVIVVC